MEFAVGYGDHRFPPHDLPFQVSVGVYFAGVVMVGRNRLVGGEFFKPHIEVMVQAGFVVIDKDAGGDVHGIDEAQPLLDTRFPQQDFNFTRNIDEFPRFFGVEPQFFGY